MSDDGAMPVQPRPPPAPLVPNTVLAEALTNAEERTRLGLPVDEDTPLDVVVELNLRHRRGLPGAEERFDTLHRALGEVGEALRIADTYVGLELSVRQARTLARADAEAPAMERAIYRIWPDFPVSALLDRSVSTVKGDAAQRSYDAAGADVTWAVVDSGIAVEHPHFAEHDNLGGDVAQLHRDYTAADATRGSPLTDGFGHGTHVAGIIAGGLAPGAPLHVVQHVAGSDDSQGEHVASRDLDGSHRLAGVAPRCRLVSLKTLDDGAASPRTSSGRCATCAKRSTATASCCASTG